MLAPASQAEIPLVQKRRSTEMLLRKQEVVGLLRRLRNSAAGKRSVIGNHSSTERPRCCREE